MQHALQQELGIKANIYAFSLAPWITEGSIWLEKLREYVRTKNQAIINELKAAGVLQDVKAKHNIIVTVGRSVIAQRLGGTTTYSGTINYGALGTGGSPNPVNGSTQLQTEAYRKLQSSLSYDSNIAYADFFYAAGDCANTTYTEFGNFIDGAAGANTGQLFSYIATGGWVKSGSMFVSCQYTIN